MSTKEFLDNLREVFDMLAEERDRLQKEEKIIKNQLDSIKPVLSGAFKLINYLVELQSSEGNPSK